MTKKMVFLAAVAILAVAAAVLVGIVLVSASPYPSGGQAPKFGNYYTEMIDLHGQYLGGRISYQGFLQNTRQDAYESGIPCYCDYAAYGTGFVPPGNDAVNT